DLILRWLFFLLLDLLGHLLTLSRFVLDLFEGLIDLFLVETFPLQRQTKAVPGVSFRHLVYLLVGGTMVADSTARATATSFDQRDVVDDDIPLTPQARS